MFGKKIFDVDYRIWDTPRSSVATRRRLVAACESGDLVAVRRFLRYRRPPVDINYGYYDDELPICIALRKRNHKLMEMLLYETRYNVHVDRNDIEIDGKLKTPLLIAVEQEDFQMVTMLVHYGCNVNPKKSVGAFGWYYFSPPLVEAAYRNNIHICRFLIESGCHIDAVNHTSRGNFTHGHSALSIAVRCRHEAIARLLLSCKANVDRAVVSDLLQRDNLKMLRILLPFSIRSGLFIGGPNSNAVLDPLDMSISKRAENCALFLLRADSRFCRGEHTTGYFKQAVICNMARLAQVLVMIDPMYLRTDWVWNHSTSHTQIRAILDQRNRVPSLELLSMGAIYRCLGSRPMNKFESLNISHGLKEKFSDIMFARNKFQFHFRNRDA